MHIWAAGKSDIFRVRILPNMTFFGPNETEIVAMIFLSSNLVKNDVLGSLEGISSASFFQLPPGLKCLKNQFSRTAVS